jgi:photosystem II stability/assembly factor-like uncharacterized protein
LADAPGVTEAYSDVALNSRGFGILDVGFRSNGEAFAVGGSGSLYKSADAGK